MAKKNYIWLIAYINRELLHRVDEEITKYGYDIETYIPTVKVLKKKFKGRNMFEFVPLLFNYGFFKISHEDACNPDFLLELRHRISAIYGWVKDPANIGSSTKLRTDNISYGVPAAAMARDEEVAAMIKTSESIDIYSSEDLDKFEPGDFITLKGYPFDNMPAEIVNINKKKREIKVKLLIELLVKEVTVSYENVFYTVYQGYDDSVGKGDNYDEMESRSNSKTKIDKILFQSFSYEEE